MSMSALFVSSYCPIDFNITINPQSIEKYKINLLISVDYPDLSLFIVQLK